jgi:hypothetical protein
VYPSHFLSCLRHAQQGKPKIHVPLSHVIWVSKSGLVIEVHVLRRTSWGLKLVNVSGSFQGDDSSSAADDWVRGAMNAAYKGVFAGDTSCFPRINNIRRCQDPAAPSCGHKPLWRSRESSINSCADLNKIDFQNGPYCRERRCPCLSTRWNLFSMLRVAHTRSCVSMFMLLCGFSPKVLDRHRTQRPCSEDCFRDLTR